MKTRGLFRAVVLSGLSMVRCSKPTGTSDTAPPTLEPRGAEGGAASDAMDDTPAGDAAVEDAQANDATAATAADAGTDASSKKVPPPPPVRPNLHPREGPPVFHPREGPPVWTGECNPPYVIQPDGVKRYKPECIK